LREEAEEVRHQMEEALKAYEELHNVNEELQQVLRGQPINPNFRASRIPQVIADSQPLTQKIMAKQVPQHFMVPKMGDQMQISRCSNVVCCKIFVENRNRIK